MMGIPVALFHTSFHMSPGSEAPFETGLLPRPHTMSCQGRWEQTRKLCMPIQTMFTIGHFQQMNRRWRRGPGPCSGSLDASEPGGFPGAQLLRSCVLGASEALPELEGICNPQASSAREMLDHSMRSRTWSSVMCRGVGRHMLIWARSLSKDRSPCHASELRVEA